MIFYFISFYAPCRVACSSCPVHLFFHLYVLFSVHNSSYNSHLIFTKLSHNHQYQVRSAYTLAFEIQVRVIALRLISLDISCVPNSCISQAFFSKLSQNDHYLVSQCNILRLLGFDYF